MLLYVSFFLFVLALLLVMFQKSHFLRVLLVLELMTLALFIIISNLVGMGLANISSGFCLVFLVFGVYEAANGLGLLVSRTRSSGLDQLSGLFRLFF